MVLQFQVKKKKKKNKNKAQQHTNRENNTNHTYSGTGNTQFFSTTSCGSVGKVFKDCNSYQAAFPGHFSPSTLSPLCPLSFLLLLLLETVPSPTAPRMLINYQHDIQNAQTYQKLEIK